MPNRKAPESNPPVKLRPPVNQRARESERVAAGGARATVGVAVEPRDSASRTRARRAGRVPAQASETPVLTGLSARRPRHGLRRPKRPTRKPKRRRVSATASVTPRLGLEPRTYRLTAGRSTIELSGNQDFMATLPDVPGVWPGQSLAALGRGSRSTDSPAPSTRRASLYSRPLARSPTGPPGEPRGKLPSRLGLGPEPVGCSPTMPTPPGSASESPGRKSGGVEGSEIAAHCPDSLRGGRRELESPPSGPPAGSIGTTGSTTET